MSSKSSYNVNNHNDPGTLVPISFIEGAIQGLRTEGSETAYWFPFTSASKNDTSHNEPSITENMNLIYYSLPDQQSFKAATEFLTLLKQKIADETLDPNEKLPPCFYEAAEHKAFLKKDYVIKDHPEPETLGKTKEDKVKIRTNKFSAFAPLNNTKLKTYGDIINIKNLQRYLEEKRIESDENIVVPSLLKQATKMRTAVVCQYLPATRPITLVMPAHLGGHYHTYAARIDEENNVETLKISTLLGYPDSLIIDGMAEGIAEALQINKKKIAKPLQAFVNQGDGVSCGPLSTTTSLQINPALPLAAQIEHIENSIHGYKRNRGIVKKALAEVYYSMAGLRLKDENQLTELPNVKSIEKETAKYVGLFNKVRPCTFGIYIQHGDECAIYGARILDNSCELISMSSLSEEYDEQVLTAIRNGIQKVLSVNDDFFTAPIICDGDEGDEVEVAPTTTLVAVKIDPNKPLAESAGQLKKTVFGSKAFRKPLDENVCEICYSFMSPELTTEQVVQKRDEWDKNFNTQLSHVPPPIKKTSKLKAKKQSALQKSLTLALQTSLGSSQELRDQMYATMINNFDKTNTNWPVAKRMAKAIEAAKIQKGAMPEKRVIQWAAGDILEALYEQQQKNKEHHLQVAIAASIVGILLPGISHAVIWIIYSVLHKDDVIKLTFNRNDYEHYMKENDPNFDIEKRVNNYDKMPLKKHTDKKKNKTTYFFEPVYTDGNDVNGEPSDQFAILLFDKKKAAEMQKDFEAWEKKNQFDVAAAAV